MDSPFLSKLTETIEANLGNPSFGADDLAKKLGMSHTNLLRKVRSYTGKSINQLIKEIRLKKAFEMMQTEGITVSEVAFKLGFSSPSYFAACFREAFGYPPGEARNMGGAAGLDKREQAGETEGIKKPVHKRKIGPIVFVAASAFLVVLFCLVFFTILSNSDKSADTALNSREKSITVLPFKSLSDDPEKQYQADGMMVDIHANLSRIRDLRVIPCATVEKYR